MQSMTEDTLDGELTSAVDMPTQADIGGELAWSLDAETELLHRAPWRSAWARAGLFVFAGLVLAGIVAAVGITMSNRNAGPVSAPSSTPPAMPTSQLLPTNSAPIETPTPPPVATPPVTTTVTVTPATPAPPTKWAAPPPISQDDEYLWELSATGIKIHDRAAVIAGAHEMCRRLAAGDSRADIAQTLLRLNSTLTDAQAAVIPTTAAHVYCPQYATN